MTGMSWHQERAAGMHRLPDDIVGYTFRAETYCPPCTILEVEKHFDFSGEPNRDAEDLLDELAGNIGIDREDESSFDSGDFPKVVFRDMLQSEPICECGRSQSWHDELSEPCGRFRPTGGTIVTDHCGNCGTVLGG